MSNQSQPPPPQDPSGGDPGGGGEAPPPPGQQPPPPAGQQPPPPAAQQPAAPQPGAAGAGAEQPGDLVNRFLAKLIDFVILWIVFFVVVVVVVVGAIFGAAGGGFGGFGTGTGFVASAVSAILGAAIYLGYFALMESSRGQTIGKMLIKLEVRGPDGSKPTLEQAAKRNIWTAAGILGIIPILGAVLSFVAWVAAAIGIAVTINNDTASRQGWHDRFAGGTYVVKTG